MVSVGGSGSNQSSESHVFGTQDPYLADIYNQAQNVVGVQAAPTQAIAQNISNRLSPALGTSLDNVGKVTGSTYGYLDSIANGSAPGQSTLGDLMSGGPNPYLDSMVNAAGNSVYRNLSRNILPAIRSGGNAVNPYGGGGSREGIATGLALSDANQQISDLATNLYGGAYDADQARRLSAAQQYTSNAQNAAQQNLQNVQALPGIYSSGASAALNLGLSPYQQAWNQLLNYKQIISDPAVLNSSIGTSSSSDFGFL